MVRLGVVRNGCEDESKKDDSVQGRKLYRKGEVRGPFEDEKEV